MGGDKSNYIAYEIRVGFGSSTEAIVVMSSSVS